MEVFIKKIRDPYKVPYYINISHKEFIRESLKKNAYDVGRKLIFVEFPRIFRNAATFMIST